MVRAEEDAVVSFSSLGTRLRFLVFLSPLKVSGLTIVIFWNLEGKRKGVSGELQSVGG